MAYNSNFISPKKRAAFEKLKKTAKSLLWEYDIKNMSTSHLKRMLIERIMQFGDPNEIRLLLKYFTYSDLADYFSSSGWKIFSKVNFKFWFEILRDYKKGKINWNQLYLQRQLLVKRNIFWKY